MPAQRLPQVLPLDKLTASEFNTASAGDYTGFALGCPAMGAEQLEESEFEPMFRSWWLAERQEVALFGSYGWGDGQWMRDWARMPRLRCPHGR